MSALLTDRDVLAINQDKLGKQGYRVLAEPSANLEIWVRELENKEWAVALLNTAQTAQELTADWKYFHWFLHGTYDITDVWTKQPAGDTTTPYTARVESHDIALLRLKPRPATE
jgi:alpha-galactosidase